MPGHSRLGTSALLEREEEKALVKEDIFNAFLAMPCIMECKICTCLSLKDHNSSCIRVLLKVNQMDRISHQRLVISQIESCSSAELGCCCNAYGSQLSAGAMLDPRNCDHGLLPCHTVFAYIVRKTDFSFDLILLKREECLKRMFCPASVHCF